MLVVVLVHVWMHAVAACNGRGLPDMELEAAVRVTIPLSEQPNPDTKSVKCQVYRGSMFIHPQCWVQYPSVMSELVGSNLSGFSDTVES